MRVNLWLPRGDAEGEMTGVKTRDLNDRFISLLTRVGDLHVCQSTQGEAGGHFVGVGSPLPPFK